jgi:hypothetical protein
VAALAASGVSDADLLAGITIEPALWPTVVDPRLVELLLHLRSAPARQARLHRVEQVLHARLDLSGTTLAFVTDRARDADGPFGSEDVDAVRLVALAVEATPSATTRRVWCAARWPRQRRGAWTTTVANAMGHGSRRSVSPPAHEGGPVSGHDRRDPRR